MVQPARGPWLRRDRVAKRPLLALEGLGPWGGVVTSGARRPQYAVDAQWTGPPLSIPPHDAEDLRAIAALLKRRE